MLTSGADNDAACCLPWDICLCWAHTGAHRSRDNAKWLIAVRSGAGGLIYGGRVEDGVGPLGVEALRRPRVGGLTAATLTAPPPDRASAQFGAIWGPVHSGALVISHLSYSNISFNDLFFFIPPVPSIMCHYFRFSHALAAIATSLLTKYTLLEGIWFCV